MEEGIFPHYNSIMEGTNEAIEEERMIPSVIDVEYKELHDMIYSAFDKALDVLKA